MPYIGKSPHFGVRNRFIYTASAGNTSKSGADDNGATLIFTDGAYVDVYLNGALLNPDTAYVTTTANTIGSISAMSDGDILEVIVYDVFSVADTVSAASGGTFSGGVTANAGITMGGTTPTLTIGDAGAEDTKIVFDGNAQDFHIGLDDTDDSIKIGLGSALGTTAHIISDSAGHVTMPLQPSFHANFAGASAQDNFAVGSAVTIAYAGERYDVNGDYAEGSATFTAPVTGKYLLNAVAKLSNVDSAADTYILTINTSNRNYIQGGIDPGQFNGDVNQLNLTGTVICDMDASDTSTVSITQTAGSAQTDINDGHFQGTLIS